MREQKRYYYLWAVIIMVVAFLISCGSNIPKTPDSIVSARKSVTTEVKQTVGIPTVSQTLLIPTGTMEPTFAYWATAQQARFDVQGTQSVATKQSILGLATNYPQMCGYQNEEVSVSPDGNWIASDCRIYGDFFRVFQTHGSRVWDVPYSKIFPYYPEFLGSVRALHWSVDGNYLYFANSSCCADVDAWTNGDILYRLNLQNGKWILLIPGNFNYYSFSPDGQYLTYLLNNQAGVNKPIELHMLNMVDRKEKLINAGNFEMAWITWKQDGLQLVLIAQTGNIYTDDRKFALVAVDLQKKKTQIIIPLGNDGLSLSAWSKDDVLTISKSQAMEYNGYYVNSFDVVYYDLKINQFVIPTIIP